MRKAEKVITTMMILLSNPDMSACPFTSPTLTTSDRMLPEPIASDPTLPHTKTNIFSSTAGLQDIPMHVPMTAATPKAHNDDDQYWHHLVIDNDDSSDTTPAFPLWDAFYNDFLLFSQTYSASTPSTNVGKQVFMPAVSPADDDPTPRTPALCLNLEDMFTKLDHLLHSDNAPPSLYTTSLTTPLHGKITSDSNNDHVITARDQHIPGDKEPGTNNKATNECSTADSDNHDKTNSNNAKCNNNNNNASIMIATTPTTMTLPHASAWHMILTTVTAINAILTKATKTKTMAMLPTVAP